MPTLEALAARAVAGERDAVHKLVTALQPGIYQLAVRMLWQREDAEDATQEILVRVVTRLSKFDGRSRLTTWVWRVASNYLLDVKKSPVERRRLDFVAFAEDLATGGSDAGPAEAERSLLVEEVKIGCTLAMLQCLDRPHRLAYVLAEILELAPSEAALALAIEPAALRKRLQRAREQVEAFTRANCGLVDDAAACRCNRRVDAARRCGRVDPQALQFARAPVSFAEVRAVVRRAEAGRVALAVHRSSQPADAGIDFARRVATALAVQK